jgi:hypothetical protein
MAREVFVKEMLMRCITSGFPTDRSMLISDLLNCVLAIGLDHPSAKEFVETALWLSCKEQHFLWLNRERIRDHIVAAINMTADHITEANRK